MEPREGPAPQRVHRQRHDPLPAPRPGAPPGPPRPGRRPRSPGSTSGWSRRSAGWPRRSGGTDPDFDLDFHLRWVALPAPGTERQLLDLAAGIINDPFDRTRPLWEFVVVEGLEGGRAAMIQKLHHADRRRRRGHPDLRAVHRPLPRRHRADEPGPSAPSSPTTTACSPPRSRRSPTTCVAASAWPAASAEGAAGLVVHPSRIAALGGDLVDLAGSATRQLMVTDPARSPMWTERSLRRRIELLQVPVRSRPSRRRRRLGGSLNDLFVTAAAGGAGAYHRERGFPVDDLRMSMPDQHPHRRVGRRQLLHPDPRARAGRDRGPGRALRAGPPAALGHPRRAGAELRRRPRRVRQPPADVAVGADGPPAGGDRGLRRLERAGRAVPALHRRGPHGGATTPWVPPAARPGTSRSCRTTASSTWGSTSTPAP